MNLKLLESYILSSVINNLILNLDRNLMCKIGSKVRKLTEDLAEMKVEKMIGKLKVTEPGHSVLTKQLNSQLSAFKEKSAKGKGI